MGQILHRSATTTEAACRAIQHSQQNMRALARRHGIIPKTVAKWKRRGSTADRRAGPSVPKSTVLSVEQEAIILAFRKHALLPLDDFYALQATIPQFTRFSLHGRMERHGINGIEHWLTKPNYSWTNGKVERINRTIKDATVKRYFYDTYNQLKAHLNDFLRAYNFAQRRKTLKGLTPYEYLCTLWTQTPDRFTLNPIHQMPRLNIQAS